MLSQSVSTAKMKLANASVVPNSDPCQIIIPPPLVLVGLGLSVGEGLGLGVGLGLGNHIAISTRGVIIWQGVENGHNTGCWLAISTVDVPLIEKCTYTDYIIREELLFILTGFQDFCRFISYVCELVHCCDALHSRRLHETTESTSKNDGSILSSFRRKKKKIARTPPCRKRNNTPNTPHKHLKCAYRAILLFRVLTQGLWCH